MKENENQIIAWFKIIFGLIIAALEIIANILWRLTIPAIIILSVCKITMAAYPFSWSVTIFAPMAIGIASLFTCITLAYLGKIILD